VERWSSGEKTLRLSDVFGFLLSHSLIRLKNRGFRDGLSIKGFPQQGNDEGQRFIAAYG
jgi:hypothetical protein